MKNYRVFRAKQETGVTKKKLTKEHVRLLSIEIGNEEKTKKMR